MEFYVYNFRRKIKFNLRNKLINAAMARLCQRTPVC